MNMSNYEMRARARESLGNSLFHSTWLLSVGITIVTALIIAAINYVGSIASILLMGPIYVGLHFVFLKIARNEEDVKFEHAFSGMNSFGSNVILGVMHNLFVFLWTLLFIIPGIIKSYSYAMVYFIKADYPEYGWRECLEESERLMKGHRWDFFVFNLSFIGWDILCLFTLGIGYLWLDPYKSTANAIFYEELKRSKEYI